MSYLLAIDPGTTYSAYAVIDKDTYRPCEFGKIGNYDLMGLIHDSLWESWDIKNVAIEKVASYGMAVGAEVFETCEWIGRFTEGIIRDGGIVPEPIYRREEKLFICFDSRAKDASIHRALVSRFAKHDLKTGKGTKKNPDWFYGFSKDVWAAYAVGVTWIDKKREEKLRENADKIGADVV